MNKIILLFLLLNFSFEAYALRTSFRVPIKCQVNELPQVPSKILPKPYLKVDISKGAFSKKFKVESKDLLTFIEKSQQSPYDFDYCIYNFLNNQLPKQLKEACGRMKKGRCVPDDLRDDLILEYQQKRKRSSELPKIPQTRVSDILSDRDKASENLSLIRSVLQGDNNNCEKIGKTLIEITNSENRSQFDQLDDDCKKAALREYMRNLSSLPYPRDCLNNTRKKQCIAINKHVDKALGLVKELMKSFEELVEYSEHLCEQNFEDQFAILLGINSKLQDEMKCMLPPIGGTREVNANEYSDEEVPSGNGKSFNIKRVSEKKLEIEFDVNFRDKRSTVNGEASVDDIQHRMRSCLNVANQGFKGPNGISFNLKLKKGAPARNVDILRGNRSTSGAWNENIDCEVIVHELLHTLGLVDDYHEGVRGYHYNQDTGVYTLAKEGDPDSVVNRYPCRSLTRRDSVMWNQYRAFSKVFDQKITESVLKNPSKINIRDGKASLLTGGQFNAIVFQGCLRRNEVFNKCSKNAYTTFISDGRGDFKDFESDGTFTCPPKPKECNDDSWIDREVK